MSPWDCRAGKIKGSLIWGQPQPYCKRLGSFACGGNRRGFQTERSLLRPWCCCLQQNCWPDVKECCETHLTLKSFYLRGFCVLMLPHFTSSWFPSKLSQNRCERENSDATKQSIVCNQDFGQTWFSRLDLCEKQSRLIWRSTYVHKIHVSTDTWTRRHAHTGLLYFFLSYSPVSGADWWGAEEA